MMYTAWLVTPGLVENFITNSWPRPSVRLLSPGTTHFKEPWPHSNEGFFVSFNFSYTYYLLEAE